MPLCEYITHESYAAGLHVEHHGSWTTSMQCTPTVGFSGPSPLPTGGSDGGSDDDDTLPGSPWSVPSTPSSPSQPGTDALFSLHLGSDHAFRLRALPCMLMNRSILVRQ